MATTFGLAGLPGFVGKNIWADSAHAGISGGGEAVGLRAGPEEEMGRVEGEEQGGPRKLGQRGRSKPSGPKVGEEKKRREIRFFPFLFFPSKF